MTPSEGAFQSVEEIRGMILARLDTVAISEKFALIEILAARIFEEQTLRRELHTKFICVAPFDASLYEHDMEKLKLMYKIYKDSIFMRDNLLKRIEAVTRVISTMWRQVGMTGMVDKESFIEDVKNMVDGEKNGPE